jgi:hypothetical protein
MILFPLHKSKKSKPLFNYHLNPKVSTVILATIMSKTIPRTSLYYGFIWKKDK